MKIFLFLVGLSLGQGALAVEGETRAAVKSEDAVKTWGTYVAFGTPYPSLVGINAAFNMDEHMRASIGYGEIEVTSSLTFTANGVEEQKIKAQTYSAGMDYLFLDTWAHPVLGAHAGYFSVTGNGEFEIQGIKKSTGLLYGTVGVDHTAANGFNIGTGFNVAVLGGHGLNYYVNLGYFF